MPAEGSSGMNQEKKRNIFFVLTMILMSFYLLWRLFFTLPTSQGFANMAVAVLLWLAETVTVLTTFELFTQKMRSANSRLGFPVIPPEEYPHVDVFIATHNEPVDILYKTVNAMCHMDYPDKSKVHIYFCDDGDRESVAQLAEEFGVGYLGLSGNKLAKSGNLNNALSKTHSPLIATFDADMIPQHTFLMKTVPYFFLSKYIEENGEWRLRREDEVDQRFKMGLIQTPQSFYNPDLFQFNLYAEDDIPNEQNFFSNEINVLRNASNAISYTGSNTLILRQGLVDIGGFPYNTITEDFEVSVRLQQEGYITYATDEVQAAGLTTTNIPSMIKQRIRWASGIIQSLQNTNAIFSKKLPLSTRITYLGSFLYWWSFFFRLVFLLSPILFALFDFQIVNARFEQVIICWLPSYMFYSVSMRYLSSNIRNQRWSQVVDTIFMPYLILPVLLETFHIHEKKFKVTSKSKMNSHSIFSNLRYALPYIFLLVLSILALLRFVSGKYGIALLYSSIIIFWLAYNMTSLIYSILFTLVRPALRDKERIKAVVDAIISFDKEIYYAKTIDVSESGLALELTRPIYFPENKAVDILLSTPRYKASLSAHLVHVNQQEEMWIYAFSVEPKSETDQRQYFQIIYDRHHTLPKELNMWMTAYDDIVRNVSVRFMKPFSNKRQKPRITLNRPVTFDNGINCTLRSFNFDYFSADNFSSLPQQDDVLRIVSQHELEHVMELRYTGKSTANGQLLLEVLNFDYFVKYGQVQRLILELEGERILSAE